MFKKLQQVFSILGHSTTTVYRYKEIQEMRAFLNEAKTLGLPIPAHLNNRLLNMGEQRLCDILEFRYTNQHYLQIEKRVKLAREQLKAPFRS